MKNLLETAGVVITAIGCLYLAYKPSVHMIGDPRAPTSVRVTDILGGIYANAICENNQLTVSVPNNTRTVLVPDCTLKTMKNVAELTPGMGRIVSLMPSE